MRASAVLRSRAEAIWCETNVSMSLSASANRTAGSELCTTSTPNDPPCLFTCLPHQLGDAYRPFRLVAHRDVEVPRVHEPAHDAVDGDVEAFHVLDGRARVG